MFRSHFLSHENLSGSYSKTHRLKWSSVGMSLTNNPIKKMHTHSFHFKCTWLECQTHTACHTPPHSKHHCHRFWDTFIRDVEDAYRCVQSLLAPCLAWQAKLNSRHKCNALSVTRNCRARFHRWRFPQSLSTSQHTNTHSMPGAWTWHQNQTPLVP